MIKFTIITLFREAIEPYLKASMMWKATEKGLAEFDFVNLRDFGLGPHKSVDDTPYGGGDGMLLRCEPVFLAIESVKSQAPSAKVLLPTPVGELWTQELARRFAGVADNVFSGNKVGGLANYDSRAFATTGANDEASPVTTAVGAEQTESLLSVSRRRPADDLWSRQKERAPRNDGRARLRARRALSCRFDSLLEVLFPMLQSFNSLFDRWMRRE